MPRTSQEQTQERHTFLLELFRQQPDISRQDALSRFKERFGGTINLKTFNELREQAQGGLNGHGAAGASPQNGNEVEVDSRRAAADFADMTPGASAQSLPKVKAKGTRQKNIFIDASKEQLAFLERVVQQLQEAGASNLRIDHSTDRWMVLVVDGK